MEGYSGSVRAPQILNSAGVNTIIKTDHPVLAANSLMHFAAKAHARGLDKQAALAAVTSNPAASMGLAGRIGQLTVGAEADFVIWDRDPFENGARVSKVFIDGNLIVDNNLAPSNHPATVTTPAVTCFTADSLATYTITNVGTIYTGASTIPGSIVVANGQVSCVGVCTPAGSVFNANGGTVIPGLVEVGSSLGLAEISQEADTLDGSAAGSPEQLVDSNARYGLKLGFKHVSDAFKSGVTVAVSPPLQTTLARGISVAFRTGVNNSADAVIPWSNASTRPRHYTIGNLAKEPGTTHASVSGQISKLPGLLRGGANIIHVNQADEILGVLDVCNSTSRCVIFGGAEAHLVAPKIAAKNIPVILSGARCFPNSWEKSRCSDDAITRLTLAGVTVGLASGTTGPGEIDFVRNLRWEAGFAVSRGLSTQQAVAATTSTLASILGETSFGLIATGREANFVVFNGDPFAYQTSVQLIALKTSVTCHPTLD